jgi:hypothetical protein
MLGTDLMTTTIESGVTAIVGIPAGTYDIRFSKSGIKTLVISGVSFGSEEPKNLGEITLEAE